MNIHFWPTLKILTYTRIARGILYTFDLENLKNGFISFDNAHDYIQQMEEKVDIVLRPIFDAFEHLSIAPNEFEESKSSVLTYVQNQVLGLVMMMGIEIRKWYQNHKLILHDGYLNLRKKLTWFSFGIIDTLTSADNFIRDENLNIIERFHLACMYYFEDDAKLLHGKMSIDEFDLALKRIPRSRCMEIWLRALERDATINWKTLSLSERKGTFFKANSLGIRKYFTKLAGRVIKQKCIVTLLDESLIHHFDLYSCFAQIDIAEMGLIFKQLKTENIMFIIKSFLCWPLQSIFLDFVKTFEKRIDVDLHCDTLEFILYEKLGTGWKDYQYENLLGGFINLDSGDYLEDVMEDKKLSKALNFVLKSSKPLDLRKYRLFLDTFNKK